jgi:hypothetical protein
MRSHLASKISCAANRGCSTTRNSYAQSTSAQRSPFWLTRAWVNRRNRQEAAKRLYRFVQLQTNRDEIYDCTRSDDQIFSCMPDARPLDLGFRERSAFQWFVLSSLHVWMVSCRLKKEKEVCGHLRL